MRGSPALVRATTAAALGARTSTALRAARRGNSHDEPSAPARSLVYFVVEWGFRGLKASPKSGRRSMLLDAAELRALRSIVLDAGSPVTPLMYNRRRRQPL